LPETFFGGDYGQSALAPVNAQALLAGVGPPGASHPSRGRKRWPIAPICAHNREIRTGGRSPKSQEICGLITWWSMSWCRMPGTLGHIARSRWRSATARVLPGPKSIRG